MASGTFGYGIELAEAVNIDPLGAIITKSITLLPREGNPPPRIVETAAGMINSIGLANVGSETFVKEILPQYDNSFVPEVIVNIAGSTETEYIETLKLIESVSSNIIGYEINISCPNVSKGGMEFGVDCDMTAGLTERLREVTDRLLIMKLSPNVTDIADIGKSAQEAGADAVSAINTVVGMSVDVDSRTSNIYTTYGGLSGPAIKPIGLAMVHKLFNTLSIPVIGIGGIINTNDAVEYILAGAAAVQVGTASFRDPKSGIDIVTGIKSFLDSNRISKINDLVGGLKTHYKNKME
jgi:dihydroorotate dehydrogenase (NAD+) catalytic subunit